MIEIEKLTLSGDCKMIAKGGHCKFNGKIVKNDLTVSFK